MSFESEGSSRNEHSLFANLTNEEVLERVAQSVDLAELKRLRILMTNRALFADEPDELADGIFIIISMKIDELLQRELDDIVEIARVARSDAKILNAMEIQFKD